jgi:hypothetical protein
MLWSDTPKAVYLVAIRFGFALKCPLMTSGGVSCSKNPSGLNAHWTLDAIATAFSAVRIAADEENQDLFPERTVLPPPAPL